MSVKYNETCTVAIIEKYNTTLTILPTVSLIVPNFMKLFNTSVDVGKNVHFQIMYVCIKT